MLTPTQIKDYKYFKYVENWSKSYLRELVAEMNTINKKKPTS